MSLLNKATIITTPTAHSNGTLHSIKGGEVADFDVVRGSAATRVNAEGLIEDISLLSGELVTNGDFSNGSTDWTLGTGWSIGENKAICEANGGFDVLNQGFVLNSGNSYKVTYTADLSLITSGTLKLGTFGNSVSERTILDGTNTAYLTASGTSFAINEGGAIGTATITNISVIEITDATNIPRIDYTTGEGVVLLEPQSTNLIPYSSDFTSLDARDNAVAISNQVVSPSGLLDADEITFDGTLYGRIETPFSATNGATYTISVYLKNKDLSDVTQVWLGFANVGQGQFITITDEWQRYDITLAANGTTEYPRIQFSGTGSLYAWGFQTEALTYATSYIPTSGAIATRLADSLTGAGDVNTFNSTEGVLYAEIAALSASSGIRYITLSDGINNSNAIRIYYEQSNNVYFQKYVNGTRTTNILASSLVKTDFNKIAIRYNSTEFSVFVNGVNILNNADTNIIAPNTLNKLGFVLGKNTLPFFGKTKCVAVWKEALTDSELQSLTTI